MRLNSTGVGEMAQFPALPLWTDSYLADTMHLSCVESGAYLHLLIAAWRSPDCNLPDDNKRLARYAKCTPNQWAKIRETVMAFWVLDNEKWTQKRLLKERNWVTTKRTQQSQAGQASALKRNKTQSTNDAPPLQRGGNGEATPTPTPTPKVVSIDTNVSIDQFDRFWDLYPRQRRGGKDNANRAYDKAISENRATDDEIIDGVKRYAGSSEVTKGYAKGAAAWLNDDRWASDYSNPSGNGRGSPSIDEAVERALNPGMEPGQPDIFGDGVGDSFDGPTIDGDWEPVQDG